MTNLLKMHQEEEDYFIRLRCEEEKQEAFIKLQKICFALIYFKYLVAYECLCKLLVHLVAFK